MSGQPNFWSASSSLAADTATYQRSCFQTRRFPRYKLGAVPNANVECGSADEERGQISAMRCLNDPPGTLASPRTGANEGGAGARRTVAAVADAGGGTRRAGGRRRARRAARGACSAKVVGRARCERHSPTRMRAYARRWRAHERSAMLTVKGGSLTQRTRAGGSTCRRGASRAC